MSLSLPLDFENFVLTNERKKRVVGLNSHEYRFNINAICERTQNSGRRINNVVIEQREKRNLDVGLSDVSSAQRARTHKIIDGRVRRITRCFFWFFFSNKF